MKNIVVVGVGNILFMDEGVGVYAAKYLRENFSFSPDIEIIDGGTLGFKLMTYYQTYDKVIILDTVSVKDEPGSVYNMPSDVLMGLGSYRQTAHEVEVVEMLEICSMLDKMAEVNIIGIIPEDIESVKIDLTEKLKKSFKPFINEVIKELEKSGVVTTKHEKETVLEEIIADYNSPSHKLLY
ncbi:HyaD/HybD family hydrogenase maturation endopeptidase [Nitrosophilus alvini]|uniref:HyaD/HybD family hydrogenase maturation endopeptidase n=1 Tax=Nitrosophilus alvini TaxID=2714855 RepID=UPI00190D0F48|nr:HyaD/HybD family hydrogenase maturation endopeptidase [Nitrosophilus alvini]